MDRGIYEPSRPPPSPARLLSAFPQLVAAVLEAGGRACVAAGELPHLMREGRELVRALTALVREVHEVAELVHDKLGELDVEALLARVDRVEEAILNTERASINLDRAFEGSIEGLPSFMSRRAKSEARKVDPTRPAPPADPCSS